MTFITKHWFNLVFIFALIPCLFWQFKTTEIQWLWVQTPAEYDLYQYHNINMYPASTLRIGNQLENKKYSQLFFKTIDRFFYPLNFNLHFSEWRIIFLPLFIFGLFTLKRKDVLTLIILLALPLILINIIGYNNQYMYSFCPFSAWLNIKCLLKK